MRLVRAAGVAAAATLAGVNAASASIGRDVAASAVDILVYAYELAPALVIALALFTIVPVVALLARAPALVAQGPDATRRHRPILRRDQGIANRVEGQSVATAGRAYLEVIGSPSQFALPRDFLSIGREDDNDIRIPSRSIHRYHAAIHCAEAGEWRITDLSGLDGNGLRVNGYRCGDMALSDGDVIDLGPGKLRFRASGLTNV